jgi:DNA-binding IscR family transcriptional regulator
LPEFVDTAVREIDDRLRVLKDEASRLEAARAALVGGARRRGRAPAVRKASSPARAASRRNGGARGGRNTRASETLELVRKQPGITIPEIAEAMKIQPNYLYRVLPRLASAGDVRRDGQGWHPASSSTATDATAVKKTTRRRRAKATKPQATQSASRTTRSRKTAAAPSATTSSRTARGATRASVLAALAGGEAMTAGQVATKAGLARPTVSTTLSKLAKSGEVQKADRGYRLAATAEPSSNE